MKILQKGLKLDLFFDNLERNRQRILFLDYDGTLAPFTAHRQDARPYPGIEDLLCKIHKNKRNRMMIVSGRTIPDIKRFFPNFQELEIWGCHGFEHLSPEGKYHNFIEGTLAESLLQKAQEKLHKILDADRIEIKPCSLAVHWRNLHPEKILELQSVIQSQWEPLLESKNLKIQAFDGGWELLPITRNKGSVVREILAQSPPNISAAYFGDDLTDEDAFQSIKGKGLAVLVHPEKEKSHADLRIHPPAELLDLLARWI